MLLCSILTSTWNYRRTWNQRELAPMWATLCYNCGFVSSVVTPGFCDHVLLQDYHKLANYKLIIQSGGWSSAMKLPVSVDLRWRAWAWPPVDMGSLSKTDIAGAEVEGGLARTLGATVSRCNKSPRGRHNWICASTTGNINTSCKRRLIWLDLASWVGILLWTSFRVRWDSLHKIDIRETDTVYMVHPTWDRLWIHDSSGLLME